MESMYDKLGELLSDALDSGFIPPKEEKQKKTEKPEQKAALQKDKIKEEKTKLRPLPENVKAAFNKAQIPESSTFDEARKIYREKLMYYHPDRRNENPVLQKVAKEKTEILLENWKIIEEYYKANLR